MFVGAVVVGDRSNSLLFIVERGTNRAFVTGRYSVLQVVLAGYVLHHAEVEAHNILATALVADERRNVRVVGIGEFGLAQRLHDLPVAVTEAVDTLLAVAYDEYGLPGGSYYLLYQVQEHVPLQQTRVLELVNHDMPVTYADFLKDEVRIAGTERFG